MKDGLIYSITNLAGKSESNARRLNYLLGVLQGISIANTVIAQFNLYKSFDSAMESAKRIVESERQKIADEIRDYEKV